MKSIQKILLSKNQLTLFNQSPATSSGVVAWLELAELDLLALGVPPGGVLELPPEGVDASDLEVLDEGWSEPWFSELFLCGFCWLPS